MKRWMIAAIVAALVVPLNAGAGQVLDVGRLKPDVAPFLAAGCVDNDQEQGFVCPREVHRRFGCGEVRLAEGLGGFGIPIAACVGAAKGSRSTGGITHQGCMLSLPINYIVYTHKGFRVLRSPGELIAAATPIDTPEKAASLVLALDSSVSLAPPSPGPNDDVKVRGGSGRDAAVVKGDAGITVRLFQQRICGCGTHPVEAVEFRVSSDGQITAGDRKVLQESRQQICVD